jgi:hypothetical protein
MGKRARLAADPQLLLTINLVPWMLGLNLPKPQDLNTDC